MKVLIVHSPYVEHFPPVRNLVKVLDRNGYDVTLLTRFESENYRKEWEGIKTIRMPDGSKVGIKGIVQYEKRKHYIRNVVKEEMRHNDVLWTTTDTTVRELGSLVFKYKHVMQLMELIEDVPRFPFKYSPGLGIGNYAQRAFKVVVPEENRAFIQKAWWDLKELPSVFPNKIAESHDYNNLPEPINCLLNSIQAEGKKIVLYQGVFYEDRDLIPYVKAINLLGAKYQLLLMGRETDYLGRLLKDNPNIIHIPFIAPPNHLAVTEKAHIGLLPYKVANVAHYSKLNPIFCAPNKIFEYAAFGIPMIGTDLPGLSTPFNKYGIGYTVDADDPQLIANTIIDIDNNYDEMSKKCSTFYNSYDLDSIVNRILL